MSQTGIFTEDEAQALGTLADKVIPASDEFGVPGAGDSAILAAILVDAERHETQIHAALSALNAMARDSHGAEFVALAPAARDAVAAAFREARSGDANLIANLTAQAYYRDDRVMASLGMEPRPPHPDGYDIEQGDWSLLDPVRGRQPFYRVIE